MLNRVIVTINGSQYTVVGEESEEYICKTAGMVDGKIGEIKGSTPLSEVACTALAAMNIADMYFKTQQTCDSLRTQIRTYIEENARLRAEIMRLKKR